VIATSARSTAVTEITDDAHGRRNDVHFEIMLINASGEKADRTSIAAIVPVQKPGRPTLRRGRTGNCLVADPSFFREWRSLLLLT
jgi:hypothetical protein